MISMKPISLLSTVSVLSTALVLTLTASLCVAPSMAQKEVAKPKGNASRGAGVKSAKAGLKKVSRTSSIVWLTDIDKALALAKKRKMPVMLDLYTDWCGWCKRLDKDVYPDKAVKALAKKFICIKANPEKDKVAKEWAEYLGVTGFPYIAFFNAKGKPVLTLPGYADAPTFALVLTDALAKFKE